MNSIGRFVFVSFSLALFVVGCKGEDPRPTLDYAPDNVEKIRELQGLEMPGAPIAVDAKEPADENESVDE